MKDTADNKTIDMLKPAAKTNAERQREYRQRQKQECGKRIDMRVDLSTYNRLGTITKSPSAILKSLLCKAFKLSRIQASLTEYKTHHC